MKRLFGTLFLLTLLLAACGGATPATSPTSATSAPASATSAPTVTSTEPVSGTDTTTDTISTEPMTNTGTTTDTVLTEPVDEMSAAPGVKRIFSIIPEESKVSYTVDEVFLREGTQYATAVGVTQEINGKVFYTPEDPQNSMVGEITIDISAFKSDSDRRDSAIKDRWLESTKYPIATFKPTKVEGLPETYTEGTEVTFQMTGDLTVREVTTPVTFETTATINDIELVGKATATVQMTDFGFDPPDIAGILKAENDVLITFEFVARAES